jgi:molybdopterin-containing oxidoreductase family iron-sulfur binding subunit
VTPALTSEGSPDAEAQPAAVPAASPSPAPNQQAAATPRTFEDSWRKVVHDGFVPNTALAPMSVGANAGFLAEVSTPPAGSGDLEISILPDPCVYDGRFANNGWMQELPNPLTKITWDNVALISPATAARLGVNQANDAREKSGGVRGIPFLETKGTNMDADVVTLTYQGAELGGVPMWIAPGQPDDVVTIYMGYGRTRAGRVGTRSDGTAIGYDAFKLRRSDAMDFGFGGINATGGAVSIASTQIHFNMEGRDLLRVWDAHHLDEHLVDGKQHNEYDKTMYDPDLYQKQYAENYKWAMSIDLNSCVGCNACVLACQSENNIPVVGKEQVERSREMHWMRIDTYFGGKEVNDPEGPHFQPVLCMQCEQAPCEVVCPVTATVHSPEGLNDMVYNRCVGTRYCSNNCPYKVRRFNFFLYQDWDTPQYKLMRNPEVTVRSRGVMEKCTYCTQRISMARIEAEKDGRKIQDGEVVTACQAVCPTGAIVFGDMNDPLSKIAKIKKDERNYNLLNELNTQPRTTYMAELKNYNPEMPGYKPPVFKKKAGEQEETKGEAH